MSEYGEPWRYIGDGPFAPESLNNFEGMPVDVGLFKERIAACINACAGIPTEELQKLNPGCLKECLARLPVADWLK